MHMSFGHRPENAVKVIESRVQMRWGDMDAMGHINNTVYFRFLEQVRCDWLENVGFGVSIQTNSSPVLINTGCTFLLPMHAPGTVITMYVCPPGRSSLQTFYEIRQENDERLFATASAKLVWIDLETEKSTPIPQALLDVLP
jgi:acyl-CoA thioester hydrolase